LYQKAIAVPTPLLRVKVNGLQELKTYTYGVNKNDEGEVAKSVDHLKLNNGLHPLQLKNC